MLRRLGLSLVAALVCVDATANEIGKIAALFENVCVGSQLHAEQVGPILEKAAEYYGMDVKEYTLEQLKAIAVGSTRGWGIFKKGAEAYIVYTGKKQLKTGNYSESCSISTISEGRDDLKALIEEKYRSRKIVDEVQGSTTVVVYRVELFGHTKKTAIAIQAVETDDPNLRILSLSLYDYE